MIPASLRTPPKMRRVLTVGAVGAAMGLSLLLSACGTTSTPSTGGNNANCPSSSTVASWHLVNPGKLTIASDTTYAPAEYSDPTNPSNYIGYDMDLARESARLSQTFPARHLASSATTCPSHLSRSTLTASRR